MNEGGTELKTSKRPNIQQKVEGQRTHLKSRFPKIEDPLLNEYARDKVAAGLKLDKRGIEIEKAKNEATTDALTGLHNRRWFVEQLEIRIAEANRRGKSFTLLMFDLDHFKSVNDGYGHMVGDEVLKKMGEIKTRKEEPLCRYGGEEFIQIRDISGDEEIRTTTARYNESFKKLSREVLKDKPQIPNAEISEYPKEISVSIGVVTYTPGMSLNNIVYLVDQAMYHSKQNGRNRTTKATEQLDGKYSYWDL